MTGPDAYQRAADLLEEARGFDAGSPEHAGVVAEARAYADLAMVAATVRETVAYIDGDDWRKVLS